LEAFQTLSQGIEEKVCNVYRISVSLPNSSSDLAYARLPPGEGLWDGKPVPYSLGNGNLADGQWPPLQGERIVNSEGVAEGDGSKSPLIRQKSKIFATFPQWGKVCGASWAPPPTVNNQLPEKWQFFGGVMLLQCPQRYSIGHNFRSCCVLWQQLLFYCFLARV